ncbi:allatostatin-A receptor-like, partial [Limulus polyphemus]|uniref:Allatostatin-A receptor-like n=1 Tax=Limulus polyphemus TaxID=6850 RepID=A0ABM1BV64_LIMPO
MRNRKTSGDPGETNNRQVSIVLGGPDLRDRQLVMISEMPTVERLLGIPLRGELASDNRVRPAVKEVCDTLSIQATLLHFCDSHPFFLPVAIMATAYSLIIWKLWISELPGERNLVNITVQHRSKKKVVKLVAVVLIVFVCCWTPFQVIILYSQFGHSSSLTGELPTWFPVVTYFATYFAFSNSALNPIIYGGFCNNFRQGLCAVLLCKGSGQSLNRP